MNVQASVANRWVTIATGVLVVLFAVSLLMPDPGIPEDRAMRNRCSTNLHQIALALQVYAEDSEHRLPEARAWCNKLRLYFSCSERPCDARQLRQLTCPALPPATGGYALNAQLDGRVFTNFESPKLVLCFEAHPGWNLHGGPELVLRESRHPKGTLFLLMDGHVAPSDELARDQIVWGPRKHD